MSYSVQFLNVQILDTNVSKHSLTHGPKLVSAYLLAVNVSKQSLMLVSTHLHI